MTATAIIRAAWGSRRCWKIGWQKERKAETVSVPFLSDQNQLKKELCSVSFCRKKSKFILIKLNLAKFYVHNFKTFCDKNFSIRRVAVKFMNEKQGLNLWKVEAELTKQWHKGWRKVWSKAQVEKVSLLLLWNTSQRCDEQKTNIVNKTPTSLFFLFSLLKPRHIYHRFRNEGVKWSSTTNLTTEICYETDRTCDTCEAKLKCEHGHLLFMERLLVQHRWKFSASIVMEVQRDLR